MIRSTIGALIGVVLVIVGLIAGAIGCIFLYSAVGSPFTGIGVFDPAIEVNGKVLQLNEGWTCFALLILSLVTATIGGMMTVASLARER